MFVAATFLSACATAPKTTAVLDDFDNSYRVEGEDKNIAFVGRKVEVAGTAVSADPGDIVLDLGFVARYEILELVHGAYDRPFIDFVAFDHYGFPKFAKPDIAMLYVRESSGKLYHLKYQWDPVHRTQDGRYAFCGDPYFELDEEERADAGVRALEPIAFDPPVSFRLSEEIAKRCRYGCAKDVKAEVAAEVKGFYAPPAFDLRGGRAMCKMGVYPDELNRIKYETVFRPDMRREMCYDELGIKDSYTSAQGEAIRACEAALKAKGVP